MKRFNSWAIFSIFMAGVIYSSLYDFVGTIPEHDPEPITVWNSVLIGVMVLFIWGLGWLSKPKSS